jgi:hypothetical protein
MLREVPGAEHELLPVGAVNFHECIHSHALGAALVA